MENRPFESKSKLSLDKILSEIDEIEKRRGTPDRIWSMDDINNLLESTGRQDGAAVFPEERDLLGDIEALGNRYSPLSGDSAEGEREKEDDGSQAAQTVTTAHDEAPAQSGDSAEDEREKEDEGSQAAQTVTTAHDEAPAQSGDSDEGDREKGDDGSQAAQTATTAHDEAPAQSGDSAEDEREKEDDGSQAAQTATTAHDEAPAQSGDSAEDELEKEDDGSQAAQTAPTAHDEGVVTIKIEPIRGALSQEMLAPPATRYFGEQEQESGSGDGEGLPGLFDEGLDKTIFTPVQQENAHGEEQEQDEYKDRFIKAIESGEEGSEPIEKPGLLLRRGLPSETSGLEPLPQVIPAEELAGDGAATKMLGTPAFTNPVAQAQEASQEQLVLSGFADEQAQSATISEEELHAELEKKRTEKKKKFVLLNRFDEEDSQEHQEDRDGRTAAAETADNAEQAGEHSLFEYEKPEQRGRIYSTIKNSLAQANTSVAGLCIIEGIAFALMLIPKLFELLSLDAAAFERGGAGLAAANIILLAAAAYLALPSMVAGFKAVFRGRAVAESAGALAVAAALIQAVSMFFDREPQGAANYFYSSAAIFVLLLIAQGKLYDLKRILGNFEFCAFKKASSLYSIRAIDNEKDAFEVGRSLKMGNPDILYSGRISFAKNFISNSRDCTAMERGTKRGLIIAGAVGAVTAVIAGIVSGDVFQAISAFTGAFCLSVPASSLLTLAVPLRIENKRLNASGAMVAGYDAAQECAAAVAAAVDSADLFDRAACEMHGMRDFKTVRIDDVLLYATAVVLKSGGPLCDVFNRIIGGSLELLPPVKDLLYEDRLGLSATIYGQRVLLGNRNLLVHHNIEAPLKSEENRYKNSGRKVLYIAIDSQPAAVFVINYVEDKVLAPYLRELEDNGFHLVVRTDDPNVTDELIGTRFGVAAKNIKVTFSRGAEIFRRYRDSVVPVDNAAVLHDGSALSYFKSIAACGRLAAFCSRHSVLTLAVQVVTAAGAAVAAALGAFEFISPLAAVLVHSVAAGIGIIFALAKKPV